MEKEVVLYAFKADEKDGFEKIITDNQSITQNPSQLEKAKKWALANGYDRLRVAVYDGFEMPDFISASNAKTIQEPITQTPKAMTPAEIQEKIAKAKKAIASPATPEQFRPSMREKLARLEAQLVEAESPKAESPATADRSKAEAAAPKANPESDSPSPTAIPSKANAEAKTKAAPKAKVTKENKAEAEASCRPLIEDLAALLESYRKGKPAKSAGGGGNGAAGTTERKKKRITTVIADGMAAVFRRALRGESTREKVGKIKTDKLKEAKTEFSSGLKKLRVALGGISSDNQSFIDSFEKQVDELIAEIIERQSEMSKEAANKETKAAA